MDAHPHVCGARSPRMFLCSLPMGHEYPHEAHTFGAPDPDDGMLWSDVIVDTWGHDAERADPCYLCHVRTTALSWGVCNACRAAMEAAHDAA
jgi:hypothetical protein